MAKVGCGFSLRPANFNIAMSAEDLFAILNRDFYSALSPAAQIQISNAVDLIERGLYTSGLTAWCTLIVTLYDTVACFSLEKRYMWPGGISLIKVRRMGSVPESTVLAYVPRIYRSSTSLRDTYTYLRKHIW